MTEEGKDLAFDRSRAGRRRRDSNPWISLINGLAVLAVGIVFWLDHLDRIVAMDYLRWWPVILIAYGLAHLPQRRWIGATIFLLFGLAFLPSVEFLPHLHLSMIIGLWPLLISAGGVSLIQQALRPSTKDSLAAGAFRSISFMGGSVRTIDSDVFPGGDAVAVMGGCEITINSKNTTPDAVIDVVAFWGGIEVRVPRGWQIENHVTALLGGFSDNTATAPSDGPRLIIRGTAIMGGIEVRNRKGEE